MSRREIKRFSPYTGTERDCKRRRDTKSKREKEKEREEACRGASRGGMPRMLSHRLLPPSSYRSLFHRLSSLLVHLTHSRLPSLSLFMDLFRLSLAALDIFTASCRRVDLVCITPLLLRGPLAVHPPKLSRRHDLCFLRPSGGLIPFCCRMYTCSGGALSPPPFPRTFPLPFPASCTRSRASTNLPHTTDGPRSSRSRRPPSPGALRLLSRLLFSASVTLSCFFPFSSFDGAL